MITEIEPTTKFICEKCGDIMFGYKQVVFHAKSFKHYEFKDPRLQTMRLMIV